MNLPPTVWMILGWTWVIVFAMAFARVVARSRRDERQKTRAKREDERWAAIIEGAPRWALTVLEAYLGQEEPCRRDPITGEQFARMMDVAWQGERPEDDRLPVPPTAAQVISDGRRWGDLWDEALIDEVLKPGCTYPRQDAAGRTQRGQPDEAGADRALLYEALKPGSLLPPGPLLGDLWDEAAAARDTKRRGPTPPGPSRAYPRQDVSCSYCLGGYPHLRCLPREEHRPMKREPL